MIGETSKSEQTSHSVSSSCGRRAKRKEVALYRKAIQSKHVKGKLRSERKLMVSFTLSGFGVAFLAVSLCAYVGGCVGVLYGFRVFSEERKEVMAHRTSL